MIQFWNRVEKRLGKRNIQILIAIFVMALVCGAMLLEQKIMKRFHENVKVQHTEKTDGNPQKEDEQTGTEKSSEKDAGSSEVEYGRMASSGACVRYGQDQIFYGTKPDRFRDRRSGISGVSGKESSPYTASAIDA